MSTKAFEKARILYICAGVVKTIPLPKEAFSAIMRVHTEGTRSGDVCERRRGRKQRAKRSGSGRNLASDSEQKISGTATGHNGAVLKTNHAHVIANQ